MIKISSLGLRQKGKKMNDFHNIIKVAALEFARANAIVMPGDIVLTNWGGAWKKARKVQIYAVGSALAHDDFDPQQREFRATLEMTYYALRLKANGEPRDKPGCGIVLRDFITQDGVEWKESRNVINNAVVHWKLPESWPYIPPKEVNES